MEKTLSSHRMDWKVDKATRTLNLIERTFEYYNAGITQDTFCSKIRK